MTRLKMIEAAIREIDRDGLTADQARRWLTNEASWLLERVRGLEGALRELWEAAEGYRGKQDDSSPGEPDK